MRRFTTLLVLLTCLCAACGPDAGQADAVRLWTGLDAEFPVIQKVVADFQRQTGLRVEMLKVPFEQLRNKFLIAAPAGLGPDLVIGPQDWVGVLATAEQLEPLPEEVLPGADFVPVAVQAVKFQGRVYSLPLFMECNALFRNTDLMPDRPTTMSDLVRQALELQQQRPEVKGFYFDLQEPYFAWPFFSAEGAYLLGEQGGITDPDDVGVATPGAVRAAEFLRSLRREHGLIPSGVSENISRTLFLENKAAVIINGPWILANLRDANQKLVDQGKPPLAYAVDPFPTTASGGQPRPLVGVQGIMLNRRAARRADAIRLMQFLASDDSTVAISQASGRPPVRRGALDRIRQTPDIAAFARIAEQGVPMPNHPAVNAVWTPLKSALELITTGTSPDAGAELRSTAERIEQKINLMLE